MIGESTISTGEVPNLFYDLIVFVSPSLLVILGFTFGLPELSSQVLLSINGDVGAMDFIVLAFAVLFVAYEYGRMVEAISHTFVTKLFNYLRKFRFAKKFLRSSDYEESFKDYIDVLPLPIQITGPKRDNKWTILFFALLYCPHIGRDLLKRYAWEKLARSSAFTFLLLLAVSFGLMLLKWAGWTLWCCGDFGFGSGFYTTLLLMLTILTYLEFYQRKCWNNDLLIKVFPVLLAARQELHCKKEP